MNKAIRRSHASTCPRCNGDGIPLRTQLTDRILQAPGTWAIRRCDRCRIAWLDPQPHPDDLGALYEGTYMTHAAPAAAAVPGRSLQRYVSVAYGYGAAPRDTWRRTRLLPLVDDVLGGAICWLPPVPGGTLLDVGCGNGALIARLRALGWRVCGVEPDPAAATIARDTHGLDVVGSLDALGDRSFDAITMHHVIEHVPDPPATIRQIVRHLAPGGRLVMVTPNIESLGSRLFGSAWVHWDPPRHLQLFSLDALERLATEAGLEIERAWTTARYARFVGASAVSIGRTGRVGGAPELTARVAGAAFQLAEHAARLLNTKLGEELVVIARR